MFKLLHNGKFKIIPLRYNPKAFVGGTVNALTASPDGRFLVMECNNTDDGNYRPYFLQYRVRPDGQLTQYDRFGLGTGARNIVFAPSGRYAYASVPDLSSSQSLPGKILEFHVSAQGDILYPPFASVPCGPMPTTLAIDASERVAGIMDAETGFLWQYTVTTQGHLVPASPPCIAVAKAPFAALITQDGQFLYIVSNGSQNRARIYQLRRRASGGFSLLMPWAVRLPGTIWSTAISNRHHVLYVLSGDRLRLLMFRIGPQGTLKPISSLNTVIGVDMAADEEADCLYILSRQGQLRAYRIGEGGALKALGPAAAGYRMSLTVVHR